MRQVVDSLADDGIWHLEQSYLPAMLESTAYDTICHEHLEYYGLRQIKWMAERVGLKITSVSRNVVNGGSFAFTLCKSAAPYPEAVQDVQKFLEYEEHMGLQSLVPFEAFKGRVFRHREDLLAAIESIRREGKTLLGYGASTKGNVLLQFCSLGRDQVSAIAEVNEDKFGCFTPGTSIPIISEAEARGRSPDYFLVLPWHFRANIVEREQTFLRNGGTLMFPLPEVTRVRL
jgi:hypothetical protein